MKKHYYIFFLAILLIFATNTNTYSQVPAFKLIVKNIHTNPDLINGVDSTLDFDIYLQDITVGPHDPFNYAAGSYWLNYNTGIGTGLIMRKIGSDLPSGNQCPTFTTASGRFGCSPNIPVDNGVIVPSSAPGIKVLSLRVKTSQLQWNAVSPNLVWRTNGAAPFTKVSYFDPNGVVIEIPVSANNVYEVESNDPLGSNFSPIANFYGSPRTIINGQSVNFFDSTLFVPTNWDWSFPGGTPSSSTLQNPTNIVYNAPGVYSVTLTATNPHGSNVRTKNAYITVLPACIANWQNTIRINDASNVKDSITFGTSQQATNGIDTCLGEFSLPPPPPAGAFDVRFELPSLDASKKDFRRDTTSVTVWTMKFQPSVSSTNYPMTFVWNSSAFPSTGTFYLKDLVTGNIVNVNMRNQNSYVLTNSAITQLKIEYTFYYAANVNVLANWNIVSVPLLAPDMRATILFPNAGSLAYGWKNNSYATSDTLANARGYWLKFNRDTTYTIQGSQVSPQTIPVVSNWNMIGPFHQNIPVNLITSTPTGIVTSLYYGYRNGYFVADTLKAGMGYWVKCLSPGTLTWSGSDNMREKIANKGIENCITLEFLNESNSMKLYLGQADQLTGFYDLPPVPPSGIFDVRYSSDKYAEALGQNNIIKINSAGNVLKLRIANLDNHKLRLKDAVSGSIINIELQEGNEIQIPSNLSELIVVDESKIPGKFELSQNYPNPFNPITTIKYQIPKDGNVSIVLYDVLGKEVMKVVNRFETAGNYQVNIDASNLASGIYFYKMRTAEFSDIKRMTVLK